MRKLIGLIFIAILLAGSGVLLPASAAPAKAVLANVHRVLFLGDSITYAGLDTEYIETWFLTRNPDRHVEFINAGLPSETVSGLSEPGHAGGKFPRPDLHERLDRVLAKTQPDYVIACYGMNDAIYLPLDAGRFKKYQDGIIWMRDKCIAAGAHVLLVTPPVFDEVRGKKPGYRAVLDRYSDWLMSQRATGWDVADLHTPMSQFLDEKRQADPRYFLAADGIHPNDIGHWIMARAILQHLGADDLDQADTWQKMVNAKPTGPAVLKLVQQRQRMMKDAWLTYTGHKRQGMNKGLPIDQAKSKGAEIETQIRAALNAPPTAAP